MYQGVIGYIILTTVLILFSWIGADWLRITGFSDKLSIVQTTLNVVLLIPSLLILVFQIRNSYTTPRLDLEIKSSFKDDTQQVQLALMNDGDAVAVWYMVRVFVPRELISQREDFSLLTVVGVEPTNWKLSPPNENHPHEFLFTFISNGEFASYPTDGLILAHLAIPLSNHKQYAPAYRIRYFITSEKGKGQGYRYHTLKLKGAVNR